MKNSALLSSELLFRSEVCQVKGIEGGHVLSVSLNEKSLPLTMWTEVVVPRWNQSALQTAVFHLCDKTLMQISSESWRTSPSAEGK